MNLTKATLSRIWWLARGTATTMGLAVMLAVVLGVGTTALAAVPGDPFKLGQLNAVDATSSLVGRVNGAMLSIENQSPGSKGAKAPALSLKVAPNNPPLTANPEAGTATGLSADELDGKDSAQFLGVDAKAKDASNADFASFAGDAQNAQVASNADKLDGKDSTAFLPAQTYLDTADAVTGQGGGTMLVFSAFPCDPGDKILNAGGAANPEDDMIEERPTGATRWLVRIRDNGVPTTSTVVANCIDFPPLR